MKDAADKQSWFKRLKYILPDMGLSALAGTMLLLALPGINLWVTAFFSFTVIMWVFDRKRIKPWISATIAGFIYYSVGLTWVSVPVTVFGGAPLWAGGALVIFAGIVGAILFWAPYGYIMERTDSPLLGGILFITLEMLKGKYFFGGLPWLNIAQTQYNNLPAVQSVAIFGEHGLSLLVILSGSYLYKALKKRKRRDIYIAAGISIFTLGYGQLSLMIYSPSEVFHTARMVQTGILQEDKWDNSKRGEILDGLMRRTLEAGQAPGNYDIMILPETSFTVNPFTNQAVNRVIQEISSEKPLIIGYDRTVKLDGEIKYYNSAALVQNGSIGQNYDKIRLAPFGEYFPLEKQLYPIRKFFFGTGPLFSSGTIQAIFEYEDLKIAPLICFEGTFSDMWRQRVMLGANVFVLISNDAWFGESFGRTQHLAIETIRAAEYGRYMLRVTQDGISALIEPIGKKAVVFPEKEYHYSDVKFTAEKGMTLFARFGYLWYALVIIVYAVYLLRKRRRFIA
ncbi:MAG: apolipoprotein N-acyltransferase [Deferribacteraceae bacterium]|jgi:apolipoprotein N-acyltransferase|nr:apolipoprotein N-acyltransferase [Deferribacteraceae bacterium]